MIDNLSVSKKKLWHYVNQKINRSIHYYHVFGVITILFDELIKDLKNDKEIKIFNFGTLILKKLAPRKYYDIRFNKVILSQGHKILRFTLIPRVSKALCAALDLDKIINEK